MRFFPIIIALVLFVFLYQSLYINPKHDIPSPLLYESVPFFVVDNLFNPKEKLSNAVLKKHSFSLLNIWASWCYACHLEHPILMKIKRDFHIPIYAIAYKDTPDAVASLLKKNGNPYEMVGIDNSGDIMIDFGIYGTPETFLIDGEGKILYRHVGALTEQVWLKKILPIIKQHREG